MIVFILLILVNLWILSQTKEPQELTEVKEKYRILREHIASTGHPKYQMLVRCVPLTGFITMNDTVGPNPETCWDQTSLMPLRVSIILSSTSTGDVHATPKCTGS